MPGLLRFCLFDVDLSAAPLILAGEGRRFVYCRDGAVEGDAGLGADEGAFLGARARLIGAGRAWLYEIAPARAPLRVDPRLSLVLARTAPSPMQGAFLMRADRIESQAGSATPRHFHRGPGVRRLVYGRILAEIGDHLDRIDPDGAWFETGHDAVIGANIAGAPSAFIRVMALPLELEGGRTSFVAADALEAKKPRAVAQRIFGETVVDA